MTNILQLPKLDGTQTAFVLARNAGWYDQIFFAAPGFTSPTTITPCQLSRLSSTVLIPDTTQIKSGQPIEGTAGVPFGAYVGPILGSGSFQMVDIYGNALGATATITNTTMIFLPVALDLTGIRFISSLRKTDAGTQVFLTAQTDDGTMLNGGANGTLSYAVPQSMMSQVPPGFYVLDILAVDPTYIVNLFPNAAPPVTLVNGIADSKLLK